MSIRKIHLNSATESELLHLPLMERELALELIRRRPFKSWESLKQAFGVDEDFARLWRNNGATLGLDQGTLMRARVGKKRRKTLSEAS